MGASSVWIFKRIDAPRTVIVRGDPSATFLAEQLKILDTGKWGIKSLKEDRFQLVENWLFERSELSRVDIVIDENSDNSLPPSVRPPELTLVMSDDSGPHEVSEKLFVPEKKPEQSPVLEFKPKTAFVPLPPPKALPKIPPTLPKIPEIPRSQVKEEPKDLRKFPRINGRLKVILISGNRSFRSFSKNMSKGGLLLENKIPDTFHGKDCRVILSSPNQKENLEFKARVIKGTGGMATRMEFTMSHAAFVKKLETWMETFQSPSKKAA